MNSSNNTSSEDLSSDENSLILPDCVNFLATYRPLKNWLLPDSIIYYMTKNPITHKSYQKCIQTCKHFFIQNPILLVPRLSLGFDNEWNEWVASINNEYYEINKSSSKIWLTNIFEITHSLPMHQNDLSFIIPKFYQCSLKKVDFWRQNIFFKDLLFFASSKCKSIVLHKSTVTKEDGSATELEKIFEAFPELEEFHYLCENYSNIITSKTVEKLLKIPHFSNLLNFYLADLPECFDITAFYEYIKRNKKTKIFLSFCDPLSERYKKCLQTIVNEILDTDYHDYKVPYIFFPGIVEPFGNKFFNLYNKN